MRKATKQAVRVAAMCIEPVVSDSEVYFIMERGRDNAAGRRSQARNWSREGISRSLQAKIVQDQIDRCPTVDRRRQNYSRRHNYLP